MPFLKEPLIFFDVTEIRCPRCGMKLLFKSLATEEAIKKAKREHRCPPPEKEAA